MSSREDDTAKAARLVVTALDRRLVTSDMIRATAEAMAVAWPGLGWDVQLEDVIRRIETLVNIIQSDEDSSISDDEGHIPWLDDRRPDITWSFWDRYRAYLLHQMTTSEAVINRLDRVTDRILAKLEDPARPGGWDRRGLVVGQVQSGKTSNYTGLVCKAADAGYRLIVVLAGIHNSLRSQTQLRLDEGFLGFDSQRRHSTNDTAGAIADDAIGAGALPGFGRPLAGSLTTSFEKGDFNKAVAQGVGMPVHDMPVLLVIKKNASILRNLHDWIMAVNGDIVDESGRKQVRGVPLLLIDDEADNASVNTATDPELDPKAINRQIRGLLRGFEQSAYVGYTATPFANIYIDPDVSHPQWGPDLFPRSFIDVLATPSNYFGPERIFGLGHVDRDDPVVGEVDGGGVDVDPGEGLPDSGPAEAVPIFRPVDDFETWMPPRHRSDWTPAEGAFPASLRGAILDFVLACSARRARGQSTAHNSMLIHVTHLQRVQNVVADQVDAQLLDVRNRLRYDHHDPHAPDGVLRELRTRWENDFEPTTAWFTDRDSTYRPLRWAEIEPCLLASVEKIQVKTMNGHSKDALDYYEHRHTGLSVIAVGGNKLSRGLTLEGLTVSYYLRASRMYDTLMQMGRWFGYRPGYEDLCRLHTTNDLRAWYREITLANDEFRAELREMEAQGATPEVFGLRVRTSPVGLSITAPNKMRGAQKVRLSFSGSSSETVTFDTRPGPLQDNAETLDEFVTSLQRLGQPESVNANHLWRGVPGDTVRSAFFDRYISEAMAWRVRPDLISKYIQRALREDELTGWNVMLVNNSGVLGEREATYGGLTVGLTTRSLIDGADEQVSAQKHELRTLHRYTIRRVLSPPDEARDLDDDQRQQALEATIAQWEKDPGNRKRPTVPSGPAIRAQRRRHDQPLLLIYPLDNSAHADDVERPMVGFCVSFPHSEVVVDAEYAVNQIWARLLEEGMSDDDEPDETDNPGGTRL